MDDRTIGYGLYVDRQPIERCVNDEQRKGWREAREHESMWLRIEASQQAEIENLVVLL